MKKKTMTALQIRQELFERYPALDACRGSIDAAYQELLRCYRDAGKLLVAGNGGSCSDSEHITGELMKSFLFHRALEPQFERELTSAFGQEGQELAAQLEGGLPAIPLTAMSAISTAYANDVSGSATFAQLVHVLGAAGDVFLGISTSGNSENIVKALMAAKAKGVRTIALTGRSGGRCAQQSDICIRVPEDETFKIHEYHLPVYHGLCAMLEADLFCER